MLCDGMSEEIIPELLGCHIRLAFLEFPVYLPEPGGDVQWLVVDLSGFCGMPFTDDNALPVPVPEFGYDFGFCRAVNELSVGSRFLTTCSYADLWLFLAASTKKILQVQVLAGFSVFVVALRRFPGGERGIRTPGTVARTPHFECGPIDHSGISPMSRAKNLSFGTANIDIFFISRHFRVKNFSARRKKSAITGLFRAFDK